IERGELTPVTQLPLGEQVTVIARVVTATRRTMRSRRGFLVDVTVSDESTDTGLPGTLSMAFFNGWAAEQQLKPAVLAMFHGKTSTYRGRLTLTHHCSTLPDSDPEPTAADLAPRPVSPATAKLPAGTIRSALDTVLESINGKAITDPVPPVILSALAEQLPALSTACPPIHRPQ